MTASAKTVWNGPKALRRFLVEIEALEPWPDNPRRGSVEAVRDSLARFGQVKPIVVDRLVNGPQGAPRIVAGHHLVIGAELLGWTHVAALENEFGSEDEARAFLLADNRTSELGTIDKAALAAQLDALRSGSTLEGTGYSEEDAKALDRELERLRKQGVAPAEFPDADDVHVDYTCPRCQYGWSGSPRPAAAGEPS